VVAIIVHGDLRVTDASFFSDCPVDLMKVSEGTFSSHVAMCGDR
jgi:hypothetical protein